MRLFGLISHAIIILSLMMITFFITDRFNGAMAFINNDITKALLLALSVLSIIHSVYLIRLQRRQIREQEELKNKEQSSK